MGYFANGTMGLAYQESYCFKCVNYKNLGDGRGDGCPIWDLHLLWSYEVCNASNDDLRKQILEEFIPRLQEPPWNDECMMFVEKKSKSNDEGNPFDLCKCGYHRRDHMGLAYDYCDGFSLHFTEVAP